MGNKMDLEYRNDWIKSMAKRCEASSIIDSSLFSKYDVKRGLRDINGQGVLTGLTEVSEIRSYTVVDRDMVPCEGKLFYQGIDIEEIVDGFLQEKRFGFEEVVYLLLFGELPTEEQLEDLKDVLAEYRNSLPSGFVRDIIMKAPSSDLMNTLGRSVLTLYSYDEKADDTSIENVLRQCLELVALFPMFAVYGYQALSYYHEGNGFFIHPPKPEYSTAENILHMLRADESFTPLEAKILDIALVLHAEHGGGNNSTFTDHVVTSSGTDTYAVISAALGSLKGPRHGGANKKVSLMFEDMKKNLKDWEDEDEIVRYLTALLNKQAFDKAGLIYGMGHAVYSISDPRARTFRKFVKKLSEEKGMMKEYELYCKVERLAPEVIAKERSIYKGVSANIDFYSGLVYSMLGIPTELYTPIFAIGRIAGWSAHRIEELVNAGKIIRPAYKAVAVHKPYVALSERGKENQE
ncbi:citrate/2-methylcitrate synthase [Eubacterium xylanophilum]|uniref:citrate/2-methylcitrate synthase n=1 Tax=Eubacterium xylanophilum TaxID=39497 RepID=UPI0004AF178C|nr:citrate/2-methylcitrate synthase [Eubacterium xylanophilum]MCR5796638.1 citrate/2-methylcitrate synthase [Eubacterium sp.]